MLPETKNVRDAIPGIIKIYSGIVAFLGLFFAYACYFNPALV